MQRITRHLPTTCKAAEYFSVLKNRINKNQQKILLNTIKADKITPASVTKTNQVATERRRIMNSYNESENLFIN